MDLSTPSRAANAVTIDVHTQRESPEHVLRGLRDGLLQTPRLLSSHLFYDRRGSQLFEQITELPEYYQTRTERELLRRHAAEIVQTAGARELVELGSGAADKTRVLLDAMHDTGQLEVFVPFDISESMIRRSAEELVHEYPHLRVHGIVGTFDRHLQHIPRHARRLVVFLGGTIGNFAPAAARHFLERVARTLHPGECLLLGTDRIKDPRTLRAAYDDRAGVTAEFNRNILRVVNHLAGGDFDPQAFAHRAVYDAERHRIEMWLVAERDLVVRLERLGMLLRFEPGNRILTEISVKYDPAGIRELLEPAGFEIVKMFTDPQERFSLTLARRPQDATA